MLKQSKYIVQHEPHKAGSEIVPEELILPAIYNKVKI